MPPHHVSPNKEITGPSLISVPHKFHHISFKPRRRWLEYFEELKNKENERERRLDDAGRANQKVPRISMNEFRAAK